VKIVSIAKIFHAYVVVELKVTPFKLEYIRTSVWIRENYYSKIHELNQSFLSIINSYFPDEKEKSASEKEDNIENTPIKYLEIEPDMIFRTNIYGKFLSLEQRLIRDKYLNDNLN
jgi:hypothetical protein